MAVNRTALPIQVDRNSPVPLYFQVTQHLEQMIESGDLATGTRPENETGLADQFGLSRQTMRRAIEYLVDRGLLSAGAAWELRDQPVEFAAEEGKRILDGGTSRGRAQLSGQIPAFRAAGGLFPRRCVKLPMP